MGGGRMHPIGLVALVFSWLTFCAYSYVPASPINSTRSGSLNSSDTSQLHLQWVNGSTVHSVSYELVGSGSNGISKGALVHFSEVQSNNDTPTTSTPWIALVSCDYNATNASQEIDIFTLARDKGAKSALLYSLYSDACIINPEYADPFTFDQVFDIFSTQSLTVSHMIDYQFGQLQVMFGNDSYLWYSSERLNRSDTAINETIQSRMPPDLGYLFATLRAYNATGDDNETDSTGESTGSENNERSGGNTALAMIILYAITGCVSALFCVVIISGAIRAIRHPERYGPRRNGFGEGGFTQSRATGLGRAILDTFPIVKFGANSNTSREDAVSGSKDIEDSPQSRTGPTQLKSLSSAGLSLTGEESHHSPEVSSPGPSTAVDSARERRDSQHTIPPSSPAPQNLRPIRSVSKSDNVGDVVPEAIGRETCPICIVDFEEGDDLRQLPCEGHHRFHQVCVDPWLLELSSSCPICRQDFLALENMVSGEPQDASQQAEPQPGARESSANRFSRYIRSAIRGRRNRQHDAQEPSSPDAVT